tara:strand:- start:619 stop:966 length:348 start_codon:yes stop_codon:yes gene_type:complete
MKYRTIRIKKRYNGLAEVRSYVYDAAKLRGEGLKFDYIGQDGKVIETMSIDHNELDRGFVTAKGIKSKVNAGQIFDLVSFKWESDTDKNLRLAGQRQMTIFDILPECKQDETMHP